MVTASPTASSRNTPSSASRQSGMVRTRATSALFNSSTLRTPYAGRRGPTTSRAKPASSRSRVPALACLDYAVRSQAVDRGGVVADLAEQRVGMLAEDGRRLLDAGRRGAQAHRTVHQAYLATLRVADADLHAQVSHLWVGEDFFQRIQRGGRHVVRAQALEPLGPRLLAEDRRQDRLALLVVVLTRVPIAEARVLHQLRSADGL